MPKNYPAFIIDRSRRSPAARFTDDFVVCTDAEMAALDAEIEASEQNEAEQAAEPAKAEQVTAEESKNDKEFDNQTTDNDMKASDIRLINDNQESGRVFFHTYDGKTICRTMTSREVQQGQVLRRREGEKACTNYFVDLFNNKYSEPQKI